jgi:hypothetical protein
VEGENGCSHRGERRIVVAKAWGEEGTDGGRMTGTKTQVSKRNKFYWCVAPWGDCGLQLPIYFTKNWKRGTWRFPTQRNISI